MAAPPLSSEVLDSFAMAARLGAALTHPLTHLDRGSCILGPLPPDELISLARAPAFARPLEKALNRAHGITRGFALPAEAMGAALSAPEGRLAVLLVSEPLPLVHKAALHCTGAAMQKQILGVVHKTERQRLRAAIGAEIHLMATQEAPTLFPALAALGSEAAFREAMAAPNEAALVGRLTEHGLQLLDGLLAQTQPPFARLFEARLPRHLQGSPRPAGIGPLARQLMKFIRRRMPEWSDIIG